MPFGILAHTMPSQGLATHTVHEQKWHAQTCVNTHIRCTLHLDNVQILYSTQQHIHSLSTTTLSHVDNKSFPHSLLKGFCETRDQIELPTHTHVLPCVCTWVRACVHRYLQYVSVCLCVRLCIYLGEHACVYVYVRVSMRPSMCVSSWKPNISEPVSADLESAPGTCSRQILWERCGGGFPNW